MTQSEINAMSEEEFKAVSPFEKKSCYDCAYLKGYVSLWCTNKEAVKARGTAIPACIKCEFWKPEWKMIDKKYKTEEIVHKKEESEHKKIKWYSKILDYFK